MGVYTLRPPVYEAFQVISDHPGDWSSIMIWASGKEPTDREKEAGYLFSVPYLNFWNPVRVRNWVLKTNDGFRVYPEAEFHRLYKSCTD